MNNQENVSPLHNLIKDLKKEKRELEGMKAKEAEEEEELTDAVGMESNHPQEIMVNRIKVSPEGFVDLNVNTGGKVYKKGETVFLLVGEKMKKLEAKFIEIIEDGKNTKNGVTTIRVFLINK
jgi:hypothetical protein